MSNFLIDEHGTQIWYDLKSDIYIRSEQIWRAVCDENQSEFFIRPHREDGPAIISKDGIEYFCTKGMFHRENGPAEIRLDGRIFWYLNDIAYTFEKWCEKLNKTPDEVSELKKKYNI